MQTVFYSWQSDLPNSTNRGFIEDCLGRAIKELRAEGSVHIDPSPDRDTQGVPGSPAIADTIFEKIDECAAFVADVSFINGRKKPDKAGCDCTRLTPNPSVLCEWGWAARSVTFDRVICVFNTATGNVEDLPFDMRGRRVLTYRLAEGEDKTEQRKVLVGKLKSALKEILDLPRTALSLEFGDREHRKPIGTSVKVEGLSFGTFRWNEIPDYEESTLFNTGGDLRSLIESPPFERPLANRDYYRELASCIFLSNLLRPVSLVVTNVGDRLLRNVRLEVEILATKADSIWFVEEREMPQVPDQRIDKFAHAFRNVAGRSDKVNPGHVEIKILPDRFNIEIKFGDVQAKASVFSETFLCGSTESRTIALACRLFADELRHPEEIGLVVDFATEEREATTEDFEKLLKKEKVLVECDADVILRREGYS